MGYSDVPNIDWFTVGGVLAYFGIPLLAIWYEDSRATASRTTFAFWFLFYLGPWILAGVGIRFYPEWIAELGAAASIWLLVAAYPFYKVLARRARQAGLERVYVYRAIIPGINIAISIALLFMPAKNDTKFHD
ncbi:hypothetical protein [Hwanghaeella sp.]|uniref:hypothetical protein n=1 Tax=Hwanghaeella sp. TaxID=2605943 RepID=UPI003CCBD0E4